MLSHIEQWVSYIIAGIVSTLFAAMTWFIRTALTSQKKIELLEKEIRERKAYDIESRSAVKEDLQEIKNDLKEAKRDILELYKSSK